MDLGIIGLAAAGRTSLFNALTRGSAEVGAYTARDRPNVGVVRVPDERVDALAAVFKTGAVYAEIRFVDYPVGAFEARGPDGQFLAELAGMDALVSVVRAFEDQSVPHPQLTVDPHRDIETLNLELTVADLALIERRIERIDAEMRSVKVGERRAMEYDRSLLVTLQEELEEGRAIRELDLSAEQQRQLGHYQFVTRRPMLLVVNIGQDDLARRDEVEAEFTERHGGPGVDVVALCADVEAELATLEPGEAAEFRRDLGLHEALPLDRAVRSAYKLLGLLSFLTVGEDECRAWTVRRGALAPEAAGRIHSDLERGFIRAEVARWDEVVAAGSLAELRRQGKLRTEGKSYVVADGDVLTILFNV